ncbi:Uncharacterized conserved protein, DUF58 family, contains vWF domain [Gracilibacillus ureilyticus]|uniref:Uncharacterized conserved protein, DUF58 family, contains vWF domain n=1 Tax=Gracilibacillus ureilyticus TaxID=531814 RepID=A0A1H9QQR8_9BACI|nr:DUF58 domain-containing protein [Gracilibacillus ureilyticus]SER62747.1 Uncharacterized conserved protein, DUF58 family, contains vWF domain [Gracilibacillus ureilyticus]
MKKTAQRLVRVVQLCLFIGILFAFAMFQGGFLSWFLFYSFTPILLYMLIIPFYPFKLWDVQRDSSANYVHAGSSVELEITIKRKTRFPLFYVMVEEFCPETLRFKDIGDKKYQYIADQSYYYENRQFRKILFPYFRKQFTVSFQLDHLPRGRHEFSTIKISTGDPFGIVSNEYHINTGSQMVVYPAVREIKWQLRANSLEEGSNPANMYDDRLTNVVSGVREYIPGDRFSWIDWKTTARKNMVMTKEFEQEKDAHLAILLLVNNTKSDLPMSLEAAIELSLSIMSMMRKKGQHLSLHILSDQEKHFTSQQIQSQFPNIQNYLAALRPDDQSHDTMRLQRTVQYLPKGTLVLTIITNLDQELVDSLIAKKKLDYQLAVCYITSEKQMTLENQRMIQQLRLSNITVQTMTEKDLVKEKWEVSATR